jgi:hypothetical protein
MAVAEIKSKSNKYIDLVFNFVIVNTPPVKAGGFQLWLKAILIGHSAD